LLREGVIYQKFASCNKAAISGDFTLQSKKDGNQKPLYLRNAADTKIRRRVKIKSAATPFDPLYKEYFEQREQKCIQRNT